LSEWGACDATATPGGLATEWTACSESDTVTPGTQTKACDNPAPADADGNQTRTCEGFVDGGVDCVGDLTQVCTDTADDCSAMTSSQACQATCAEDGDWVETVNGSTATVACAAGNQTGDWVKTCNNGAFEDTTPCVPNVCTCANGTGATGVDCVDGEETCVDGGGCWAFAAADSSADTPLGVSGHTGATWVAEVTDASCMAAAGGDDAECVGETAELCVADFDDTGDDSPTTDIACWWNAVRDAGCDLWTCTCTAAGTAYVAADGTTGAGFTTAATTTCSDDGADECVENWFMCADVDCGEQVAIADVAASMTIVTATECCEDAPADEDDEDDDEEEEKATHECTCEDDAADTCADAVKEDTVVDETTCTAVDGGAWTKIAKAEESEESSAAAVSAVVALIALLL
jgi:hypothetical protein